MAKSGFPDVAQASRMAWARQDLEAATRAVPDALINAMGVVGTPAECQERFAAQTWPTHPCHQWGDKTAGSGGGLARGVGQLYASLSAMLYYIM